MGDTPIHPFLTLRSANSGESSSMSSSESLGPAAGNFMAPATTHDISRVNYHVKHLDSFAKNLEDSANRAFPNRGRSQQRYSKVIALLVHWKLDDLFVLPELDDLGKCFKNDYGFETDIFAIPSENAHLELMMRIGALIKDHEASDTLFIVYYGGHARIDESRQSTWCENRNPNSAWLQWSAIQTLLERSISDTLILLDCCAGAASATFPNGKSITETISASSWDAIAPDPGRYSFTSTLIEVLQEWRLRTFSAAMLHAEVLARLKHPRPITINGKLFEARSTPVHFMMTANHRAPSIEIGRTFPKNRQLPSPPMDTHYDPYAVVPSRGRGPQDRLANEPNEDEPHVMISLALEDDQNLDLNAWQTWLASFPALAKYVKVQGVFKSHSTLLLLSLPVMIWDLLPDDQACSFVAFIRSNNLLKEQEGDKRTPIPTPQPAPAAANTTETTDENNTSGVAGLRRADGSVSSCVGSVEARARVNSNVSQRARDRDDEEDVEDDDISENYENDDGASVISGTTFTPTERQLSTVRMSIASTAVQSVDESYVTRNPSRLLRSVTAASIQQQNRRRYAAAEDDEFSLPSTTLVRTSESQRLPSSYSSSKHKKRLDSMEHPPSDQSLSRHLHPSRHYDSSSSLSKAMTMGEQRASRTAVFASSEDAPDSPHLAKHVVDRLEEYFQTEQNPSVGITEFFASNLGAQKKDIEVWFHRRRQQESTRRNLQNLMGSQLPPAGDDGNGVKLIFPGHLNKLLDIFPPNRLLFIDLRSPMEFEKSHIYGAINLRVPVSFVERGFDLLDLAFTDDQSRRTYAKASSSRCVIFYDRVVEFAWECPMADAFTAELRKAKGWQGEHYVLKGHYREFSSSFDKYITGDRMTQAGKDYADSLRQRTAPSSYEEQEIEERYAEWKTMVGEESRHLLADPQARQEQRRQAVEQHQVELEDEFERRNPVLFRKVMGFALNKSSSKGYDAVRGDSYAGKPVKEPRADLVEPLSRGLNKMQDGSGAVYSSSTPARAPNYDKLAEFGDLSASMPSLADDFDEMAPGDEYLQDDPAFLKGEELGGRAGGGTDMVSGGHDGGRGRERPFWKRLRTNK